jgi:hypothetical protein
MQGGHTLNKKNNGVVDLVSKDDQLRHLATDLQEAYRVLDILCTQLEGGGIVPARDVEPAVLETVPKLRNAVDVLSKVTQIDQARRPKIRAGDKKSISKNPLLI